jgi:hypothetical protein
VAPLWYCADGIVAWYVANLANAALLVTVWLPTFLVIGLLDASAASIVLPLLLVHVAGVPSAVYVLLRCTDWLVSRVAMPALRRIARGVSLRAAPGSAEPVDDAGAKGMAIEFGGKRRAA